MIIWIKWVAPGILKKYLALNYYCNCKFIKDEQHSAKFELTKFQLITHLALLGRARGHAACLHAIQSPPIIWDLAIFGWFLLSHWSFTTFLTSLLSSLRDCSCRSKTFHLMLWGAPVARKHFNACLRREWWLWKSRRPHRALPGIELLLFLYGQKLCVKKQGRVSLDVISVPALLAVFDYCSDLCLNARVGKGFLNDAFILLLHISR